MSEHAQVTVTEAAHLLGINKSAVSRQVKKFGVVIGSDRRFSFAEYQSLRANVLSPINGGKRSAHERELDIDDQAPPAPSVGPSAPLAGIAAATASHKNLQAELLRLELAERQGLLVRRDEIDEAITTLTRMLRDTLLAVGPRVAVEIGGPDQLRIKQSVGEAIRAALDGFVGELERGFSSSRVDETPEALED